MIHLFTENILIFLFLIFFFLSFTGLGYFINKRILNIQTSNFYENFIIGVFFIILYLQIHIIFLPISLTYSFLIFLLLFIGFLNSVNEVKKILNFNFFLSMSIAFLIVLNSKIYPYYNVIYDYGLYHNTYLNWLNQENIPRGIANLHDRFGYTGSSFLLAAFFNFYPFFDSGYIFTTSIFFVFLVFLLLNEINLKKNFLNIFCILILYVILKYILVESLSDVSADKIGATLLIFICYNLIKNYYKDTTNNNLHSFIALFILITLGASTWFISFLLFIFIFCGKLKNLIINYKITFLSFFLLFNFLLINFLKSGNILYPVIFPIFETDYTVYSNSALYHIKNFPKGYPEGMEWVIPKLKNLIFSNKFIMIYLLSIISLFLLTITNLRNKIYENKIFLKLIVIISLSIIFWFLNAPDPRFAKIYFWLGFILILTLYFENFVKGKYLPYFIICIFTYCIYSSLNNLALKRSNITKIQAIEMNSKKIEYNINDNNVIYISELNYTNQKFSIPNLPENSKKLIYNKNYFSKIYFDK